MMDEERLFSLQASKAANSVEYSEGSVVSKQLIKLGGGTISLFAFDKGQSLSGRSPLNAFVEVLEGKAEFVVDGKNIEVVGGEFIIIPANVPHSVKAVERFKMLSLMIKE
ncbi:MAG: cupin domain-containing protein [Candidatus Kryptoniota bacterium]